MTNRQGRQHPHGASVIVAPSTTVVAEGAACIGRSKRSRRFVGFNNLALIVATLMTSLLQPTAALNAVLVSCYNSQTVFNTVTFVGTRIVQSFDFDTYNQNLRDATGNPSLFGLTAASNGAHSCVFEANFTVSVDALWQFQMACDDTCLVRLNGAQIFNGASGFSPGPQVGRESKSEGLAVTPTLAWGRPTAGKYGAPFHPTTSLNGAPFIHPRSSLIAPAGYVRKSDIPVNSITGECNFIAVDTLPRIHACCSAPSRLP